jgi:hypothetical protein
VRVKINANFNAANADVKRWSQKKLQEIKDVVNESAINVQTGAKQRCAVDSGRLRGSIAIEPASGPGFSLLVGTKVQYAPYVEYGTGKFAEHPTIPGRSTPWVYRTRKGFFYTEGQRAQPFLHPAAEDERPKFIAAMKGVLSK